MALLEAELIEMHTGIDSGPFTMIVKHANVCGPEEQVETRVEVGE